MEILKPGKVEQRKFTCPKCGCVFVASTSDITWHQCNYNKDAIDCPCGRVIAWDNGEPYEEPVQDTQTDRERLYGILLTANPTATTAELTNLLVTNGVTVRGKSDEGI